MTNAKIITNEKQKGFTLFVALLVASAVILGSYAVSNALFFQLKQSSTNRESLKAQIVADNGVECAMYYDKQLAFSPLDYPDPESLREPTNSIQCAYGADITGILNSDFNEFKVEYGNDSESPCAVVTVEKNDGETIIKSRGYNKCDPEAFRRVERAIIVNY